MSRRTIETRPLIEADADYARNVNGAFQDAAVAAPSLADTFDLNRLPISYRQHGGEFWGVWVDNALIGTVGSRPVLQVQGLWEIGHLTMVPDWRRMGIGRMVAEKAFDLALRNGAEAVRVIIPDNCEPAVSLFLSMQFTLHDENNAAQRELRWYR